MARTARRAISPPSASSSSRRAKRKPLLPYSATPSQGTLISMSRTEWSFVAVVFGSLMSLRASLTDSPRTRRNRAALLEPWMVRTIWIPPWSSVPKSSRSIPPFSIRTTSSSLVDTCPQYGCRSRSAPSTVPCVSITRVGVTYSVTKPESSTPAGSTGALQAETSQRRPRPMKCTPRRVECK